MPSPPIDSARGVVHPAGRGGYGAATRVRRPLALREIGGGEPASGMLNGNVERERRQIEECSRDGVMVGGGCRHAHISSHARYDAAAH